MPAGYVEVDEDPIQAAEREALEETGLIVKVDSLANVYTDFEDPRGNVLVLVYNARVIGGVLSISSETMESGFFSTEEISSLPLAGMSAKKSISAWVENPGVKF
jgi:ADP-ribose pyrophosphatase YjhB (NUDIX family)